MEPFVDLPTQGRPATPLLEGDPTQGRATLRFVLDASSGWFEGHFPGRPVLPGVTQLHLAALASARLFGFDRGAAAGSAAAALAVTGTRRLKFQRPVTPGTALRLELHADASPPTRVRFTLYCESASASSGTLIVAPRRVPDRQAGAQLPGLDGAPT